MRTQTDPDDYLAREEAEDRAIQNAILRSRGKGLSAGENNWGLILCVAMIFVFWLALVVGLIIGAYIGYQHGWQAGTDFMRTGGPETTLGSCPSERGSTPRSAIAEDIQHLSTARGDLATNQGYGFGSFHRGDGSERRAFRS